MENVRKRITAAVLTALYILILCGGIFLPSALLAVRADAAEVAQYSNVLDDLKKDDNFDPADFPENPTDYSLQVITVAEGENGELFVYVYQPSGSTKNYRATYINMALCDHKEVEPDFNLYSLTWINSNGVFNKYLVNDFKVQNAKERYYNIASVVRPFDELVDDHYGEVDDTTNYKAFDVGRIWVIYSFNDEVICEVEKCKTVLIKPKATGFIRFRSVFEVFGVTECDSHFLAFSVENYDVENIYQAKIHFLTRTVETFVNNYTGTEETTESCGDETKYLYGYEDGSNEGYFGYYYSWDRITDVESFKSQIEDFQNKGIDVAIHGSLDSAQFAFQFLETPFISSLTHYKTTYITEVVILELKFVTKSGDNYNIGVVSDIISDDGSPDFDVDGFDNVQNAIEDFSESLDTAFKWLLLILAIVILIFLWPFISPILSILWLGLKVLLKVLILIISIPFKIIGFFFRE